MEQTKQRSSNIELLRIFSMLMIIGHHFAVHGGFYFESDRVTANMVFLQLLSLGGKIGVDLFLLISGYFMVTASGIRLKKAVKLWLQIFFYSAVIYLFCVLMGLTEFSPGALLKALLPISTRQWWFASSYFALYLLSPLLGRLLKRLSRKQHLLLLGVLALGWYVFPVLTWLPEWLRDIVWFLSLCCAAGFLRLHRVADRLRARTWLAIGGGVLALSFLYAVIALGITARQQSRYETVYFQTWDPLMLLCAIPLFLGFVRLPLKHSPLVNHTAAAAFGIYLIHDSNYLRYPLWQGLLNCAAWRDSAGLIPYAIAGIAGVFLVCLVLERVRIFLLDDPFAAAAGRTKIRIKKWADPPPDNS